LDNVLVGRRLLKDIFDLERVGERRLSKSAARESERR
jgi:hypothetical protein